VKADYFLIANYVRSR